MFYWVLLNMGVCRSNWLMKVIDIGYPQARTLPERTLPDCKVHTWMTFVMDSMFP